MQFLQDDRPQIRTTYGTGLFAEPRTLSIPREARAALQFAQATDRAADRALSEGRFRAAERLSHLALEARARAGGARA